MSGRNPFDDVGKPRGGTPQSFQQASAEVNRTINETVKRVHEAPPQVLPDLITGEEYTRLVPQSYEMIQQDLLDEQRFRNITEVQLQDLPTHQERIRAAKVLSRRNPLGTDGLVEVIVSDAEHAAHQRKVKSTVVTATWIFTLFVFLVSSVQSANPIVGFFVAAIMYFAVGFIIRVLSFVNGMSTVSGRAV